MSCHEKLLEKKKLHDQEKRQRARNPQKLLPQVPSKAMSPTRVLSPTPSDHVAEVNTVITGVPQRSPQRTPAKSAAAPLLEAPKSLSPIKLPQHLSPADDISNPYENITPRQNTERSPLRHTPKENRQGTVLDNLSSGSSSNILASYISTEYSPPPNIPPPTLPGDDFIDMNDSDEDSKYLEKPMGLGGMRHSDSIPTGLNIQGLSFGSTTPRQSLDAERGERDGTSVLMSPPPMKKGALSNITNDQGLSKSHSIRSPKNFLNFRKHKNSTSQTSVENYKISSPIIDARNTGPFDGAEESARKAPPSPYQGASLFTTPPVRKDKRKASVHGRSRSDVQGTDNYELSQVELELRTLKTEIGDLKLTKQSVSREVGELLQQKDELTVQKKALEGQISELRLKLGEQSSKSELSSKGDSAKSSLEVQTAPTPTHSILLQSEGSHHEILEASQVEARNIKSKPRFWQRGNFFQRVDAMVSSPSSHTISNVLNDRPQISAPIIRTEEADILGGNDNRKLMTRAFSPENGARKVDQPHGLIMSDLFNSTLEMRAQYEQRQVPLVITRLIAEVKQRGLDSEGIYRKNGATSQTNAILKAFNNLYQAETSQELEGALSVGDVNSLSSALKRYLYFHLPEPVVAMSAYDAFIHVANVSDDEKVTALAKMVEALPRTNARVLDILLNHLKNVEKMSQVNKMTYHNLSVVFAPTLARVSDGERELADMAPRNTVTEFLLVHQDEVFRLTSYRDMHS